MIALYNSCTEPHRPELYQSYVHTDDGSLRLSITLIGGYPEERSVTWSTPSSAAELVPGTSSGPYMALAKTVSIYAAACISL